MGGDDTAAFFEFYPNKNEDYLNATKTTMPGLTLRVFDAATKYAGQLGTKLTGELQAFAAGYETVLEKQQMQMTNVTTDRKERDSAFVNGQWVMTGIVYEVAGLNNSNPQESKKLFDFTMLYPQRKPFIVKADGKLAAKESTVIANRTLNKRVRIWVMNTSVNADALVWLAMSPTEDAPTDADVVKANSKGEIKAENWESLKGTFVMIKNASDINEVAYSIEITGLKRSKEEIAAEKQKMEVTENKETA